MDEPKAEAEKMKKIPAKPKHVDVIDILSSEEESSKEKSVPNKKGREVNSRKKSSRTLTSVLTAISQVACDLTNKPKEIVDTDAANANNELAVVEYLDDIYKFYKLVENESRLHDYMDSQPEIQVQQDVLAPSNNIPALNANTLLRIWTRQLIPRLRMTLVLLLDTFCFAKWPPLVQAGLKVLALPNLRRLNLQKCNS
ncbi:G2/mitotic-specific cyclin S13-6 [Lathyrus oleraceus]|uniref:G2/mitotic-specific cyclin S13-6 n=1 Tax=Pisum sativum TaxID=3888 RepID=UPI0021CEC68A|nr:G2/mitotic-specific cyclin S13-6-like [Pisum sativum]